YSFQVSYNGDAVYVPTDSACEPLTVLLLTATVTTAIHNGADHTTAVTSVPAGSTVHDSATVTGTGPAPTGTVDFTFFTAASDCTGGPGAPGEGHPPVTRGSHPR